MSTALARVDGLPDQDLAAVIAAYNQVTDQLRASHEVLTAEVMRLREQLEEKNRELARKQHLASLGEMAAGLAHEIRNPLAGIQLFASLLQKDLHDRPKPRTLAQRIGNGVQTLEGIVADILAFAGRGDICLEPTPLSVVLGGVLELVEPRREASGISLHFNPESFGVRVEASAVQLQRAVLNLLYNAMEAAGDGGRVWLDCRTGADQGLVEIEVADDGPGVRPEHVDRIFDPFFTSKDTGTGLGLSIVHRIAESHGGSVRVSHREAGGAVFTLTVRAAHGNALDKNVSGAA